MWVKNIFTHWKIAILILLALTTAGVWYGVYRESDADHMTVAFLNIGQGDAIYIESPNHNRILVDGGPPHAILNEIHEVMPFYARTIDTLIVTNPDTDHYAGFIDLLQNYNVNRIIEPGTKSDSATYREFKKIVKEKNIPTIIASRGLTLHLGGETNLVILFPDHDVSASSTNDGSIVAKLVHGNTSVMLTGDAPNKTEEYVLGLDGAFVKSTILKAGHHGSRTSASEFFISAVNPQYAVISAGVKNKYNHPHVETLNLLNKFQIPTLITAKLGTIIARCTTISCDISYGK